MGEERESVEEAAPLVPVVPVVEISRNERRSRQAWGSGDEYEEDWSDEEENRNNNNNNYDNDEDFDDVDDHAMPSPRRSPRRPASRSRFKSANGKRRVDMTPPDQKLKESEKLARSLAAEGKADKSIQEYIRCVAYSRIVYGSSHWRYAQSVGDLAQAYLDLKGYATQAEHHSETARSILLHGGHTAGDVEEKAQLYAVLIQVYRVMGQACTALKKYKEAEQALLKADKISSERSKLACVSDRDCDRLDILLFHAMARLYSKQKKFALGSTKFDKVIELMEKEYGTETPEVLGTYLDYGKMEQAKGRHANHEKVIQLFLQAHSIAAAIYKEGHPQLVDTAMALSEAYANTGWEEAEGSAVSYLEECVSMCTVSHGPTHPRTLSVQDQLCKLLVRTGRSEEALNILQSSLAHKCEVFTDYSQPVSDTYKLMASVYLSQGNLQQALRLYKKCYTIEVSLFGKSHKKTVDTQKTMELLMASPGLSKKFALSKQEELSNRPRFNSVVARCK
ncbi:tetratricopeptide repeat protein 23 [Aplysia californica]|uniref:Tetratricopeptide repeat protein 23 n=1 Tax=Aplysia californica TaxID=6500 RepID=A0ABM1AFC5_APLCA|nr:tetratricopeptide repeat protein 23 [Aplysia californica]